MMGLRRLKPGDGFSDLAPGSERLPKKGGKLDRRSVSRDATAAGSSTKAVLSNSSPEGAVFYDVHIFYYTWYGNPLMDGKYSHWDHILVPHWDPKIASSYPRGRHMPPEDIGSSFYPELNPYSSRDPDVLESHMEQIGASAAGTVRDSVGEIRSCGAFQPQESLSAPPLKALNTSSAPHGSWTAPCKGHSDSQNISAPLVLFSTRDCLLFWENK